MSDVKEKILVTIDRDIMWEYFQYYKKNNPRIRTFPFAKKITEKKYKEDGSLDLTKSGNQRTKRRSRNLNEIDKNCLMYKTLSLNDLLPINSMSYKTKKKHWGDFGVWLAKRYDLCDKNITNSIVEIEINSETKANLDNDNMGGAYKLLGDGLYVQSKFFKDDNFNHINPYVVTCKYNKEYPHMNIKITVINNDIKDEYKKIQLHIDTWK